MLLVINLSLGDCTLLTERIKKQKQRKIRGNPPRDQLIQNSRARTKKRDHVSSSLAAGSNRTETLFSIVTLMVMNPSHVYIDSASLGWPFLYPIMLLTCCHITSLQQMLLERHSNLLANNCRKSTVLYCNYITGIHMKNTMILFIFFVSSRPAITVILKQIILQHLIVFLYEL